MTNSSVSYACNIVAAITVLAMCLYYYINKYVLTDPRFPVPANVNKKSGPKPTLGESFKTILKSKYLGYIALLIIAYGVSINFVEVTWKGMIRQYALQDPTITNQMACMLHFSHRHFSGLVLFNNHRNIGQKA